MTINEYFSKKSQGFIITISFAMMIIIGFADHFAGFEYSLSIFYLAPIVFVTWFTKSRLAGFGFALISAILLFVVDKTSGDKHLSNLILYWNILSKLGFFCICVVLLSKGIESVEKEKILSRTDFLTGISNSRHLFEILQYEINKMSRNKLPLSIVYIDIDNFKTINDKFGHEVGNNLLRVVAKSIKNAIRKTDTVARVGGDEFIILFPETKGFLAKNVVEKVLDKILLEMKKYQWLVTFSIGIGCFDKPNKNISKMLVEVDKLMYEIKNSGKNNIKVKECSKD